MRKRHDTSLKIQNSAKVTCGHQSDACLSVTAHLLPARCHAAGIDGVCSSALPKPGRPHHKPPLRGGHARFAREHEVGDRLRPTDRPRERRASKPLRQRAGLAQ